MERETIFTELLLGFRGVTGKPHFNKMGYCVGNKLFATVDGNQTLGCVKLSLASQNEFHKIDKAIYRVPNSWGKKGWTFVDLKNVPEALLAELLETAYNQSREVG